MSNLISIKTLIASTDDQPDHVIQLQTLKKQFNAKFGGQCDFIVKVPGRVNLIGEHVDYSGFAVLPMALQKNILVAIRIRQNAYQKQATNQQNVHFRQVNLINVNSEQYERFSFSDDSALQNFDRPCWYHYFLCGYKGQLDALNLQLGNSALQEANNNVSLAQVVSNAELDALVMGDIPPSSGLSSSSALVCAASIAVRHALDIISERVHNTLGGDKNAAAVEYCKQVQSSYIDKLQMAANCASFERFIGTQGGGMDQAIALLAEPNTAKLIEFYPRLNSQSVQLPDGCEFFIAHCGETLNKAATSHYNRRVLETRVAAALLHQHLCKAKKGHVSNEQNGTNESQCYTLGDVMRMHGKSFEQMVNLVYQLLPANTGMQLQDILNCLGLQSADELAARLNLPKARLVSILQADSSTIHTDTAIFWPRERAIHVYEEASRVYKLKQLSESNLNTQAKLQQIGQLMNESHRSCRDLFDCSCPSLDRLIEVCNQAGALGSRLTGAGWGGCIVALVPTENCAQFEQQVKQLSKFVFRTLPDEGAVIYHFPERYCNFD